jgi:hypothetical protein
MGRPRKAKGLGDTVENVLEATGIAAVVKFIAGEDCGCNERKEKLNQRFPYFNCLTQDEYNYLTEMDINKKFSLTPTEQATILSMYQRVFNKRKSPTTCPSCWIEIMNDLKEVYNSYEG